MLKNYFVIITTIGIHSIGCIKRSTGPPNPFIQQDVKKSQNFDPPKLIFVYIIWRHGDRAPLTIPPKYPNRDALWPNGLGELTDLGIWQQFQLGKQLFQRYINCTPKFLSEHYNNKQIYVRSTDVNRTLTSAMVNLAGMFSRKALPEQQCTNQFCTDPNWPTGWIPIPVHTVNIKYDHIGNPFRSCPRALQLERASLQSASFTRMLNKYKQLHSLNVPHWFDDQMAQMSRNLRNEIWNHRFGEAKLFDDDFELVRLRGGPILADIINRLRLKWRCSATNGTDCTWYHNLKYYALSAHDATLIALLLALDIRKAVIPDENPFYCAHTIFELYQFNNQPYVKLLYSNGFDQVPQVITNLLPGCPATDELCFLDDFADGRSHMVPGDIATECSLDGKKKRYTRELELDENVDDNLNVYYDGHSFKND